MRNLYSTLFLVLALAARDAAAQTEAATMQDSRTREAITLMTDFAERTGLVPGLPARRYLWTDAFAVCNFLGLARQTGADRYLELAVRLVDQVHRTLGRHRDDDRRSGWISGLGEPEGTAHPTRGGLRIGKKLPERGPDEPFDERLEWDRDGQYFHYLTKWMHALDQVARATGNTQYNLWARELAEAAHAAFTYSASGAGRQYRMYWKMSIDLTRPLVPSMGQHDPLDGYVSYLELGATAQGPGELAEGPGLAQETEQAVAMLAARNFTTPDPLGIGGLLVDAYRLQQLTGQGVTPDQDLFDGLLGAALAGLKHYVQSGELRRPARYRLAFRELGLSIGLHALERLARAAEDGQSPAGTARQALVRELTEYLPLRDDIESWWRDPGHRTDDTWDEHLDINEVMLATSLAPAGFLELNGPQISPPDRTTR